ncbi:MAG: hypothetical protein EAX87_04520 [Candidatus Thorarchaeota archaeon]|nr:hypothetical protein [Candidatus Thorarchaeota archaeon]
MSSSDRLRKILAAALFIQAWLMWLMLIDKIFRLGFSGSVGFVEMILYVYPLVLVSGTMAPSRMPRLPLKKALVYWAVISMIMAGLCMYEGAALGFGFPRVLWSYVYLLPACLCLYYAARLKKW